MEMRPMKSRPQFGLVKMRTTTLNQNDEPVQIFTANLIVPKRGS
jgi:acyl dehydratase